MRRLGVSDRRPKAPIKRIGAEGQGNQVRNYGNYTKRAIMFAMETTTAITTSIGVTTVAETNEVGPMFRLKIGK